MIPETVRIAGEEVPVWPPDVKVQLLAAAGTGVVDFTVEHERGRVTKLLIPDLYPGSLLLFPAEYIHAVNPYGGERPRRGTSITRNCPAIARTDGRTESSIRQAAGRRSPH